MGQVTNNYGTFFSPPEYCAVEVWREEGDSAYQNSNQVHGSKTAASLPCVEHHILGDGDKEGRFGLLFGRSGTDVVISEVDEDENRTRGLHEGDVVTHIDGRPLLGSLTTAAQCMEQAGDLLAVRIQSTADDASRNDNGIGSSRKAKYQAVQHVVRQGDSVETLADLYDTTADQIRIWNRRHFPVGEPGFLFPGQVLSLRTNKRSQRRDSKKYTPLESSQGSPARRKKPEESEGRKRMLCEVREGDSLKAISLRWGVREDEVRRLNRSIFPIGEAGVLIPGQTLTLFAAPCDGLREEGYGSSAGDEEGPAFLRSLARRKTRSSLSTRGAGVIG